MERGSLRFRLIAVWVLFLIVTLQIASFGLQMLFERSLIRRTLSELTLDVRLLTEALDTDVKGEVKLLTAPTDPLFSVANSGRYWQVLREGKAVLRSPSLWQFTLAVEAAPAPAPELSPVRLTGPDEQSLFGIMRQIAIEGGPNRHPLTVVVAADFQEIERAKHRFADDLFIGMSGLAALLLLAASAHVLIGLKPLQDIRARLVRVRNGEISRLEGNFPSEVMPLVNEANALLDAQDAALDAARTRAQDLAHGLKTPLAVMATQSRALRRRGDLEIADHIDQQIQSMRRHVERELARARTRGEGPTHHQRVDTAKAIRELAGTMQLLPKGQRLAFKLALADHLMLAFDRSDFNELMGNLIDNAHKWARTSVRIESRAAGDRAVFVIEDDGPGVADTDIARILQRGERADTSVPGTGLGLAIVSDLLVSYRGDIELARSQLGGLAATVTLPVRREGM